MISQPILPLFLGTRSINLCPGHDAAQITVGEDRDLFTALC